MQLDKCNDPPCPKCGCNQTRLLRESVRLGRKTEWRQCMQCGKTFTPRPDPPDADVSTPVVPFHVVRCPRCNSRSTHVKSTRGKVRWHRCADCRGWFQSVEKER